ncbi:Diaminopimelate epimerase [invertebrate metagenome]|uniref:diaminopimelate epimerase n=1 Tax=invertebrate metagenome TaxID=1711999 RepID=A0A484HB27_9ZZZZ
MSMLRSQGPSFIKMHGLGNDFVVLDNRQSPLVLNKVAIRAIANRRTGIGCDQLIMLVPPRAATRADVFMVIYNADGSSAAACGNAARCVGALLMDELGRDTLVIETLAGLLHVYRGQGGLVTVDMGVARLDWREIPLARALDTLHLPVAAGPLADAVGVSIGNPHAVFFVPEAESVDLSTFGPRIECDALFPERTNVEVVQKLGQEQLRVRVWERGVGITHACGTGACAAVVAAVRRGLLPSRQADVILDGGSLFIVLSHNAQITMTGPAVVSFVGALQWDPNPNGELP